MATIASTNATFFGAFTVNSTTLDGTLDTFTFRSGTKQTLILLNDTAGALTPIIVGAEATSVSIAGAGSKDLSAGYAIPSIGAGATVAIDLATISAYLQGTIEITGGTGLVAQLIEG